MASLGGKVALVTGAARRVGAAIATELATAGAKVAIHAFRSEAHARELAATLPEARVFVADLTDPQAGRRLVDEAIAWGGRLDVLVNNAAVLRRSPFLGGSDADWEAAWQEALATNLVAPARLARRAAPALRQSRGVVVNLLDVAIDQSWPSHAHYGAAKAGLAWLTRTLAVALAPEARSVGVAPGIAEFASEADAAERARLIAKVPLGRAGTPADVARAVRFLVGAEYVSGTVLVVDGGRLAASQH